MRREIGFLVQAGLIAAVRLSAQSTGLPSSRSRRASTAPQAMKPSAKVKPNVLIETPRMCTSGFTGVAPGGFS